MAQHDVQSSTQPPNTPPSDPYATPLTVSGDNGETENPDDWEYEYSTTETEIYYVTLDLSIPQEHKSLDARPVPEKQRATSIWVDPSIKISEKNSKRMKGNTNRSKKPDREEEIALDDDDYRPGESPAKKSSTPAPAIQALEGRPEKAMKVQILDLHSNQPIISYGGQVFAAEWKKNIGTEFLFTEHDAEDPLPVLRNLADDVDLIAASSIRLMSKPVALGRKYSGPRFSASEDSSTRGYHAQRRHQNDFLRNLGEIKKQKGEEDEVTTLLRTVPKSDPAWRLELSTRRDQEKTRLRRVIRVSGDINEVEKAQERLAVIEQEDEQRAMDQRPKQKHRKIFAGLASTPTPPPTSTPIPAPVSRKVFIQSHSERQSEAPVMENPISPAVDDSMVDEVDDNVDGHYGEGTPLGDDTQMDDV